MEIENIGTDSSVETVETVETEENGIDLGNENYGKELENSGVPEIVVGENGIEFGDNEQSEEEPEEHEEHEEEPEDFFDSEDFIGELTSILGEPDSEEDIEKFKKKMNENGFNTKEEILAASKMIKITNEAQKQEPSSEQKMQQEYAKLTPEEYGDINKVVSYIESNFSPETIKGFESRLETAEGFREFRKMALLNTKGNLPNVHAEETSIQNPFTVDDYVGFVNDIRTAETKMQFGKVAKLKATLKKEISSRGTAQLKKDVLGRMR